MDALQPVQSFQSGELFRPYLLSGERIMWSGKPKQGIAFRGVDAFLIPFSLLWMGAVTGMLVATLNSASAGPPDFMLVIFMLVGLYFTIGRFLHDAALRRSLCYAVTNQRVLIVRGSGSSKLKSLDVHHLPMLELSEFNDGTGTIAFDNDDSFSWLGRRNSFAFWTPALGNLRQFFRITNPRKVYELIRDQAHS